MSSLSTYKVFACGSIEPCCDWVLRDTLSVELDEGEYGRWGADGWVSPVFRSYDDGKMVEEVWGNGVKAVADDEGVVVKEEINRCLEVVYFNF
ncbi:hypothetical protein L1887_04954 [Cichorium endivia]|nr:hypothetical protein L1887_04954 [Cichorium endivia]